MRRVHVALCCALLGWDVARGARAYAYYSYASLRAALVDLERRFPSIVRVSTAQQDLSLPSPGLCGGGDPCLQYIVQVGNRSAQQIDTAEVFVSGALHGDERVGPQVAVEVVRLLAEAYHGEGPYANNPWLRRLVETRNLVVMPTPNPQGYAASVRTEDGIDPNRDFAFDQSPAQCMRTVTARAVNEVFRQHIFALALTFHAGAHMITSLWGSPENLGADGKSLIPPDDVQQVSTTNALSAYAGAFVDGLYTTGRVNDLGLVVNGGAEDALYGSGFTRQRPCAPPADGRYGPYPAAQTTYSDAMLRSFVILVETSLSKTPPARELGSDEDVLRPGGAGDGHVPRNVRVVLQTLDLAQPYVEMVTPSPAQRREMRCEPSNARVAAGLAQGAVPASAAAASQAFAAALRAELGRGQPLPLAWEVGGALMVDETQLLLGAWPSGAGLDGAQPGFGLSADELRSRFEDCAGCRGLLLGAPQRGFSRWGNGARGTPSIFDTPDLKLSIDADEQDRRTVPTLAHWSQCVPAQALEEEAQRQRQRANNSAAAAPASIDLFVMARAKVDQAWARQPRPATPNLPPQSHVANQRTNASWDKTNNGHNVRGRLFWYSKPVRVTIVDGAVLNADQLAPPDTPTSPLVPVLASFAAIAGVLLLVATAAWAWRRSKTRADNRLAARMLNLIPTSTSVGENA